MRGSPTAIVKTIGTIRATTPRATRVGNLAGSEDPITPLPPWTSPKSLVNQGSLKTYADYPALSIKTPDTQLSSAGNSRIWVSIARTTRAKTKTITRKTRKIKMTRVISIPRALSPLFLQEFRLHHPSGKRN